MVNKRLRQIYSDMKQRCYNPKCGAYKDYGGRGITVCDKWRNSSKMFYEWAFSHGYRDDLTIDRINVDKGYSPDNCRWATRKEQASNKRVFAANSHIIIYKGEKDTLVNWCKKLNLNYRTVMYRLNVGRWSVEQAFETEPEHKFAKNHFSGRNYGKPIGLR